MKADNIFAYFSGASTHGICPTPLIKLNCDINELENFKIKYLKLRNLIMNGFNKVNEEKLNIFSLGKNGH